MAIRTTYAGVFFRSRLEAKWAAFFDQMGWKWAYEPIDLDGYIPDFSVTGFDDSSFLVEVKPCLDLKDLETHKPKLEQAARDYDVLLVGAQLFPMKVYGVYPNHAIGHGRVASTDGGWSEMIFIQNDDKPIGISAPGYWDWLYGPCCGKSSHGGFCSEIMTKWNAAANAVQWRPRA